MEIDRAKVEDDLGRMLVPVEQPHMQCFLDALIETDRLYAGVVPQSIELHDYLVGMMAFASRIPVDVLRPGARVLDVGSGHGRLLIALRLAFDMEAHGVDKAAYASGERHQLWLTHVKAGLHILSPFDAEKTPLPHVDGYFDLVTSQQAVEHLHDTPKLIFEDMFRVAKPGAALVIDTPNHAYWGYHLKMLRGESVHYPLDDYYNHRLSTAPRGEHYGHKREFTIDELARMITWAGFEVTAAETAMYAPGGEDKPELLSHYLWEIRNFMRAEYGIELPDPPQEEKIRLGGKMKRLGDTAIVSARKPLI